MQNEFHLTNTPIDGVVNVMSGLQRKINHVNNNLAMLDNIENFSYKEILQSVQNELEDAQKSTAEMTLDEYKEYISNKLQAIPRHVTRYQDNINIVISDAGFEAMQNDSEYENWVLDSIAKDLAFPNYLYGIVKNSARFVVHQFGATKEEYRGYSHSLNGHGNQSPLDSNTEDFWTQRHKRMKKILEMEQEMFNSVQQLQQLSNRKLLEQSARAKANGLTETSNPMPVITGVPAKYLLNMLTPDSK